MNLSVIIPTYNVEKYILKTINSLLNQTNMDFEIIIVDDGSTDNTYKIANEVLLNSGFNNYKIFRKKNGGVSSARNIGIFEASGNYLLFLDGDDYVSNNLTSNIFEFINNVESDIICWGFDVVTEDQTLINKYSKKYSYRSNCFTGIEALYNIIIKKYMWICIGSAAYKTTFLKENNIVFTEGCHNGEDQEFTYKALAKAHEVYFINKTLSFYVQRNRSISNSYNINRFQAVNAMERTYEYIINIDDEHLNVIAEKIKEEQILINYLYNFNSCLAVLLYKRMPYKKSLNYIYNDMDIFSPMLKENIKSSMKSYNGSNIKLLLKIKIYLNFPIFYCWLISIKSKIKVRLISID